MSLIKLKLLRDCVVKRDVHGVKNEVIEVDDDTAMQLLQAQAAEKTADDAKVGKPSEGKK